MQGTENLSFPQNNNHFGYSVTLLETVSHTQTFLCKQLLFRELLQ